MGGIVIRNAGNAGSFGCRAFGLAVLLAGVVWCASSPVFAAQRKRPFSIHVRTNVAQEPIRASSNLVLVPVSVYSKRALHEWGNARLKPGATAFNVGRNQMAVPAQRDLCEIVLDKNRLV